MPRIANGSSGGSKLQPRGESPFPPPPYPFPPFLPPFPSLPFPLFLCLFSSLRSRTL